MSYVLFEIIDNIGVLTLNRYQKRNALNLEFMIELSEMVQNIKNLNLNGLIVKSSGNIFCSGGDIDYFANLNTSEKAYDMAKTMHRLLCDIENLDIPTVCCINGSALGGGAEFIMAFDLRFIVNDSFIQFKEIEMGVTTGWGGTYRLVNAVGYSKAIELLLSGRPVYALEAKSIHLVNDCFDKEVIFEMAFKFCEQFSNEDTRLIRSIKKLARQSLGKTCNGAMDLEGDIFSKTWMFDKRRLVMEKFKKRKK